jgi:dephospho-CoA kinase
VLAGFPKGFLPVSFLEITTMKSWIVTGGAGTGKSLANRLLQQMAGTGDMCYFSADALVSELLKTQLIISSMEKALGKNVLRLGPDGMEVDRDWLRRVVLPEADLRAELEAILHPHVLAGLESSRAEALQAGVKVFLAEVPLHYEIGGTVSADLIIVVAASRSVQVRRMMENRGLDEQTVESFLNAQWSIYAKVERADLVIWNDGHEVALKAQLQVLCSRYLCSA